MSFLPRTRTARTPAAIRTIVLAIVALLVALGTSVSAAPAHAATQGTGFGAWAPVSAYGWHGSMLVGGVHTYCILPGAALPTGPTSDRGVSAAAAGLSPLQLTGINLLVTKYGQTDDPVQAASVGWAVKAIANWNETLRHFGYRGNSLAGAIHWTFSALAPAHSTEVQRRAVAFYDEATRLPTGATTASGRLVFTTDAVDPERGTVRVEATTPDAIGTLALVGATFADTGTSTRGDAVPGAEYAIITAPPSPGRPYEVSGTGHLILTSPLAAVRHFTTSGGQDTAGPAGDGGFDVAGADAAPRVPQFAPTITTQVGSPSAAGDAFIDDVVFAGSMAHWPRTEDGAYLPVTATAEVFRTEAPPALDPGGAPADAVHVGSLGLTSDPAVGPTGPYRVTSLWSMKDPGFYTAVWSVRRENQEPEVARYLPDGYVWIEQFGEPTQIIVIAEAPPAGPPVARGVKDAPGPPVEASTTQLAATGAPASAVRTTAAIAILLLTAGATLAGLSRWLRSRGSGGADRFGASLASG